MDTDSRKAPSVEVVVGGDNDNDGGGGHEESKQQEQQQEESVAPAIDNTITTTTTTRLPLSPTGPTSAADAFPAPTSITTITTTTTIPSEEEEEQDLSRSPPPPPTTTTITNPRRLSSTNTTGNHDENFSPHTIQRLQKEILSLHTSPSEGITFIPNDEETLMEVHAEITGPEDTPYEGGIFKIKLLLSNNHPHTPPRAFFLTKIFHPNVSMNGSGDVCVDVLKRGWTAEVTLGHVLQVIRCLLIVPFPESSLNDEAGKLFMSSYDEYARRARLFAAVHAKASSSSSSSSTRTHSKSGDCTSKPPPGEEEGDEEGTHIQTHTHTHMGTGSESGSSNNAKKSSSNKGNEDKAASSPSKATQQQKSKEARRKSLKRL